MSSVLVQCKKDIMTDLPQENLLSTAHMPDGVKKAVLSASGVTSNSYYIVNSLPSGYVKDGSRDYTTYIQGAVDKYSNIVFPEFPLLVNDKGINIGSNKTITFLEGSEVRLKASSLSKYNILKINNATNVTLYNPVVVGDRNYHMGTGGEWGMGIGVWGSSNITIYSPRVTNCWGDGIYLGQFNSSINCKNIVIKDAYLRNNRRDGISIIGVDGLLIDGIYSGFNSGTAPGTGINFEANNASSELKNIKINNPVTESNGERGIQLTAHHILNSSTNKYVDITVINHVDKNSPFSAFKFSVKNLDGTAARMLGTIRFVNPSWQRTLNNRPLHIMTDQTGTTIEVSSPEIISSSGSLLSWLSTYSLLDKVNSIVKVTQEIDPLFSIIQPITSVIDGDEVVFAVNAGGSEVKGSDGIIYGADKYYSAGNVFSTSSSISNTADDQLYQTERYGNFSYEIPLSNGDYQVTFKFSEIYHKSSGERRFDVIAESSAIISNLDIFSVAGINKSYDLVKDVAVTDGRLNIQFRTDIDNAKVAAFHVKRK